jgi:hypothetical protein
LITPTSLSRLNTGTDKKGFKAVFAQFVEGLEARILLQPVHHFGVRIFGCPQNEFVVLQTYTKQEANFARAEINSTTLPNTS